MTVDLRPYFRRQGHFFGRGVRCLAAELRALLPPEHGTVLAVGLGNRGMTADAVGPLVLENLLVTRHMETFPFSTAVAALAPGVLAATGMETAELILSLIHISSQQSPQSSGTRPSPAGTRERWPSCRRGRRGRG